MTNEAALEVCRRIHREYGTSYYWATRLFPCKIREATHMLYAFFRVPDEIVDHEQGAEHLIKSYGTARMTSGLSTSDALAAWSEAWKRSATEPVDDPVITASRAAFDRFQIPSAYADAFLWAMQQDVARTRYSTYEDLKAYMYGSAAAVGLMMTHVIGFSRPEALVYAEKLGYAMQLTNFLRDIGEDFTTRGRIYLPQDELHEFGLSDEEIRKQVVDERFISWMKCQIARADALYEEANQGIPLLHRKGRRAVQAGSDLYRMILRKIEQQGYDVYKQRARTAWWEKLKCLL